MFFSGIHKQMREILYTYWKRSDKGTETLLVAVNMVHEADFSVFQAIN